MGVADQLHARVASWIDDDPDDATRLELAALLQRAADDADAHEELVDRFDGRLQFGTAGLRGQMAAGPNRMNRAVVIAAAAGLASYLRDNAAGDDARPDGAAGHDSVVVGYDARHMSEVFARDTVAVMRGAGLDAVLLPRPLPTPVLAFAVRKLGCVAGVMVTASHNPALDNGYKVYLADGTQIVPPADQEISARIAAVGPVADIARSDGGRVLGDEVVEAYLEGVAALPLAGSPRDIRLVYTPLHGVGADVVQQALARAGFAAPIVVPEQAAPDPDFPTVGFPNPEEPGALDLAMALARDTSADLVVANDPDADRCAVAVATVQGWRMLKGDEVGVLLADHLVRRGLTGVLATSIVSSSLLQRLAAARGLGYQETLTGFKWIGRVPQLGYGYEEALGYCVAPELVRDKDGVSALLRIVELAAELKAEGRSLLERLDEIVREHGVHATDQLSVRVCDLSLITAAMQRLRNTPPTSLGGFVVQSAEDLSHGSGGLPPTDGLRYRLSAGGRVVVRPSGTEPKIKCYLEVVVAVDAGDVGAARISAAGRLDAIRSDLAAAAGL